MKKKLLSFVFALLVMIPCAFLLTACGDDGKYLKIKIVDSNDLGVTGLRIEYADELSSSNSHGCFTWDKDNNYCDSMISKDNNYIVFIDLKPGYNMGSLTMYVNGEERNLRRLSSALQMIGNPNYIDFAYDEANVMVDLWSVKADAVNEITITFKGQTEQEKYDVKINGLESSARTKIVQHADLRFAIDINGNAILPENATYEQMITVLNASANYIENLVYGDIVTFKVWFDGCEIPFNNANFLSTYDVDLNHYYELSNSYYDNDGKSVYKLEITSDERLYAFWTNPDSEADVTYDEVGLIFDINNHSFVSNETLSHTEIAENGAVFHVSGITETEYKLLMKDYTDIYIVHKTLTQQQKQSIFSYADSTLTCNFGNVPAITYFYENEDNKPRLSTYFDQAKNPNDYKLYIEVDYDQVVNDEEFKDQCLIVSSYYDGNKFSDRFELPDKSYLSTNVPNYSELNSLVYRIDKGFIVLFLTEEESDVCISTMFFTAPVLVEENEEYTSYTSSADMTKIDRITFSWEDQSFDIRVLSGEDELDGEPFTYYYFAGDESVFGGAVTVVYERDSIRLQSDNYQLIGELTVTYYLK